MTIKPLFRRGLAVALGLACLVLPGGLGCGGDTGGGPGNDNGNANSNANDNGNDNANSNANNTQLCPDGVDADGDGYGVDCPAGLDCNDEADYVHPGATEVCNYTDDNCDGQVDEGVLTVCGNCSAHCETSEVGQDPFEMPPDPDVEADGVGLDPNGDVVLDETNVSFNYLWIANRYDASDRGTVSKLDTQNLVEVARYYTVTCFGNAAYQNGQCLDVAGNPVQIELNHPSRTAVDYNFDVWVANRAFSGQPSASKIVNALSDCIDRNGNGVIDTSADQDNDGAITLDCDGNGVPDDINTVCTNGLPPEFLGHDDECVLFTTNYATTNQLGRSICLDAGDPYSGGAGNAWVGTNNRAGNNQFYQLEGTTGQILVTVDLPAGVSPYGCAVDSAGVLWTLGGYNNSGGRLTYLNTAAPSQVGTLVTEPFEANNHFYGITVDSDDNLWLGGWDTRNVFRYRPDRTSFSSLSAGTWTRIRTSENVNVSNTRGMAADLRGWIWAASNNGYIVRIPQSIADGDHAWTAAVSLGAQLIGGSLGGGMIGVGIDFDGHAWGMSYNNSTATRIDLDAAGDVVDPVNNVFTVPVGLNPYTYSDFTGYGLRNFTRPQGTYRVLLEGCAAPLQTNWLRVEWNATEPPGTAIRLRVRSGDDPQSMGGWFGYWDISPAQLDDPTIGPLWPLPADYLVVEFELTSDDQLTTPILHDFNVVWDCEDTGPG